MLKQFSELNPSVLFLKCQIHISHSTPCDKERKLKALRLTSKSGKATGGDPAHWRWYHASWHFASHLIGNARWALCYF